MMITRKDIAEDGEQAKEGKEAFAEGEEGRDEGGGAQSWTDRAGLFYDLLSFSFAPFLFRACFCRNDKRLGAPDLLRMEELQVASEAEVASVFACL